MGLFEKKIKTVGTISDFMSGEWKMSREEKQTIGALSVAAITPLIAPNLAFAGMLENTIQGRIMHAFSPLIDLAQGLSYPVAFLMLAGGMLLVMMGQKHRGLGMIKWAAIGYVGMQFVPALMEMLVDVGAGMKGK